MLTQADIQPVADELVARWQKMDPAERDPDYPANAYDLAREYCNALLAAGNSEALIRASTPAEVVDRYFALPPGEG